MATDGYSESPQVCSGAHGCSAPAHFHGCYEDYGACEAPEEHARTRDLLPTRAAVSGRKDGPDV